MSDQETRLSSPIEIRQVGNGYFVKPAYQIARGNVDYDNDVMVFQSFYEMVKWLDEHFSHRSTHVGHDEVLVKEA